jgi:hypothetical protein
LSNLALWKSCAGGRAETGRFPGDTVARFGDDGGMANRYNAAGLATNAQHLESLAKSARANMLSRTTEKATRLGAEGERLARQARAADAQRAEADNLASTHVADAAKFDARAQSLEQQAATAAARGDYASTQQATELREDAAKAREGAAVARGKAEVASDDAKRLASEAAELRVREQAIDAELADLGAVMPVTEMAVDHLEWHAEKARAMADTVKQADDLQAQAAAATARGDHTAAAELSRRAATLRDDADVLAFVRDHPPFPVDHAALQAIGVTVTASDLSAPMPELIDPSSPMNPLADASATSSSDETVAAVSGEPGSEDSSATGSDAVLPDTLGESSVAQATAADDGSAAELTSPDLQGSELATVGASLSAPSDTSFADTSSSDASFADTSGFATESFEAGSFEAGSLDTGSLDTGSLDNQAFEMPTFDAPAIADAGFDTFGETSFSAPDDPGDQSPVDSDGGFGDPGALA